MSADPQTNDDIELTHPTEIAAWLAEVLQTNTKLQLESPAGDELQLALLRVERDKGTADLRWPGVQAGALPAWLANGPVHAHASIDKIRMDFELGARSLTVVDGLPVLRMALPPRMRRHQRRQAFRVPPNNQHFPRAHWRQPNLTSVTKITLCDLSAGGLGLFWPRNLPHPKAGDELDGVEIELEREQRIRVKLRVEHTRTTPEGLVVGCAFIGLNPMAERNLLQHLNQAQRRRRALGK